MRGLLLLCVLLLFNCEDKQSKAKKTEEVVTKIDTITPKSEEKVVVIDSSKLTLEERYLPLNDDNAMDFFGEYAEIHKENKVRIYTRFGNIDLELFNKTKYHRANFIFLTKNKVMENCTIYSHYLNFDKVVQIVKEKLPKAKVEFNDGGINKSLVATIKGGFFGKNKTLKINYRQRENPDRKSVV